MKRPFKILAVSTLVGLLMLVMAVPAFAIGPPGGNPNPADNTPAAGTGHTASCAGQDPHGNPALQNGAPVPAGEDLHDAWHAECDDPENPTAEHDLDSPVGDHS